MRITPRIAMDKELRMSKNVEIELAALRKRPG